MVYLTPLYQEGKLSRKMNTSTLLVANYEVESYPCNWVEAARDLHCVWPGPHALDARILNCVKNKTLSEWPLSSRPSDPPVKLYIQRYLQLLSTSQLV